MFNKIVMYSHDIHLVYKVFMTDNDLFSFEFHSLIPSLDCKTILDAENSTTLKLFGRTRNFESICANVIGHLPYFYISIEADGIDSISPFGNEEVILALGINSESFKLSYVEKIPFYNFHEGAQKFLKIECCSEAVRKRLINFIKDSTSLQYTLYEVSRFERFQHLAFFLRPTFHLPCNSCLISE